MANEQNLRPGAYKFTQEDRKKALQKSVESRRRKKNLRECAKMFSEMSTSSEEIKQAMVKLGIEPDDLTNAMALVVSVYQSATSGDMRAARLYSDWCEINTAQDASETETDPLTAALESLGGCDGG